MPATTRLPSAVPAPSRFPAAVVATAGTPPRMRSASPMLNLLRRAELVGERLERATLSYRSRRSAEGGRQCQCEGSESHHEFLAHFIPSWTAVEKRPFRESSVARPLQSPPARERSLNGRGRQRCVIPFVGAASFLVCSASLAGHLRRAMVRPAFAGSSLTQPGATRGCAAASPPPKFHRRDSRVHRRPGRHGRGALPSHWRPATGR